jgi:ABC-type multidrug transport system ATPase subunit
MQISFQVINIQHINTMTFKLNLNENKLTCIVGKNGVGKTTLIKAINNLYSADTFKKTSPDSIFKEQSAVIYNINDDEYRFDYDPVIRSLNSKSIIPGSIKKSIDVELPMPFGKRFNFFQSISNADTEIRKIIALENYDKPIELIGFMNDIYSTKKFDRLIQVEVRNISYYCILLDDSKYIREDYLSSGEYFLISLYRQIKNRCKLIVIDEIDISLDAAAQAHLIGKLRKFCHEYQVNILFTTHSLAIMRTMHDGENGELFYMEECDGNVEVSRKSYNYIKSILFGFKDNWDKYILTEDDVLEKFLEYVIKKYCNNIFYKYKIIYIGGGPNVTDLMSRNAEQNGGFFSTPDNVISILDGDQREESYAKGVQYVHCIPFNSVEKKLHQDYTSSDTTLKKIQVNNDVKPKGLYKAYIKDEEMSEDEIFKYLCDKYNDEVKNFSEILQCFLSPSVNATRSLK